MSEAKDTSGPAFPQYLVEPVPGGGSYCTVKNGMSLRDWFAGQSIIPAWEAVGHIAKKGIPTDGAADVAVLAYELADAMLAAREGDKE